MKGRISAEGRLDRLILVRGNASGGGQVRDGDSRRGWELVLELDFDPTALGEYWLQHCEYFVVATPSGEAIGVVDDVCIDPSTGELASIELAAGWFGRRRFTLAVESVRAILPLERRLLADVPGV
jgi:hypothetical protein